MKESIKVYAEEQFRKRRTRKYRVVPADIPPKLPKLNNVKAVMWDVYGTLLGHPMGDLADHSLMEKRTRLAFRKSAREFGIEKFIEGDPAVELRRMYEQEIEKDHQRKQERGISCPEVRIEHIWFRILKKIQKRGYIPEAGEVNLELAFKVAYFFDDVQQFKLSYAGARRTLKAIKDMGLHQGIISNAQFYTPLTLNILLRNSATEDEPMKELFDRNLIFFSYRLGVAKPNPFAFEKARSRLKRMKVQPREVLCVGNDMLYDMFLAHETGFMSVLYAGDRRSVTLRGDNAELADFEPDAIIKALPELLEIIF